ncbi:MAG: hypothetical protein A2X94_14020 [Bdellovibrionales bacterium GWB1_55_8]|nr:MAG: hypothetical protein A2X94_14020 [Bdellovibrionales bacterium GWB1_55_8]
MKVSKMFMRTAIVALAVALPMAALAAPGRPSVRDDRNIRELERKVFNLERNLDQMQRSLYLLTDRVELLERGNYLPPAPAQPLVNVCMMIDSGFSRTFLSEGQSKLDAEFNVRKACEAGAHANYCVGRATLKCDDNSNMLPNQGSVCMLNDSGFNRTYRGEGRTPVEAEAKARINCQNGSHPNYCAKVAVRCDSFARP